MRVQFGKEFSGARGDLRRRRGIHNWADGAVYIRDKAAPGFGEPRFQEGIRHILPVLHQIVLSLGL
ncbi:MAG: hypothetical protein OHK0046_35880 [Anaerolineae bacterium]